jgi:hypothetical protein
MAMQTNLEALIEAAKHLSDEERSESSNPQAIARGVRGSRRLGIASAPP